MSGILRMNLDDSFANACADSEIVLAGDWAFMYFCVGNVGQRPEAQAHDALDNMAARLTLENVVKVDILMLDPWDPPIVEQVFARALAASIRRARPSPPNLPTGRRKRLANLNRRHRLPRLKKQAVVSIRIML